MWLCSGLVRPLPSRQELNVWEGGVDPRSSRTARIAFTGCAELTQSDLCLLEAAE